MTWYYRAETKGIQSWLFSTSKLREIRGGSWIIEDLPRQAERLRGPDVTVLQEAAGAISYIFKEKRALESFARQWPRCVATVAPGLQVVQAWVPESGDGPPRARLAEQLRRRRNLPAAMMPEAGPWITRTGRGGMPAVDLTAGDRRGPGRLLQDVISQAKENATRAARGAWQDVEGIELELDDGGEGMLAVIHADGTGVGKLLMNVEQSALPEFSTALVSCAEDALKAAVVRVARGASRLDLQVVLLGGDDLTVVCGAGHALEFTETWLTRFELLTRERLGRFAKGAGLRAGAGIAITSRRFPFRRAYELAEALCKAAKSATKVDGEPVDSAIAFRRITTASGEQRLGQGVWRIGEQIEGPRCAVPTLGALRDLRVACKKVARGPLRTWLTAFEAHAMSHLPTSAITGGADASPEADKLWTRIKETRPDDYRAIVKALGAARAREDGTGPALATGTDAAPWTPIRDALVLSTIDKRARRAGTGD